MGIGLKVVVGLLILGAVGVCIDAFSDAGAARERAQATLRGADSIVSMAAERERTPGGRWVARSYANEMDGSVSRTLSLFSANKVTGWLEKTRPELYLRCAENKTEVFVVTGLSANPELGRFQEASVRLRFGAGRPEEQLWNQSTDDKALFSRSPVALIKRLLKVDTLRFEFTPFNSSPAVATFDVRHLAEVVDSIRVPCGWK